MGFNIEQNLSIIKSLREDTDDAIILAARWRCNPFGNLFLEHANQFRNLASRLQYPENYLRRDVVWKVANYSYLLTFEKCLPVKSQKVSQDNPVMLIGVLGMKKMNG